MHNSLSLIGTTLNVGTNDRHGLELGRSYTLLSSANKIHR